MLKKIWIFTLYWMIRAILSIRYRIKIKGLETLNAQTLSKKGGILFLPNHPAEIDPVMVVVALWRQFKPRPIVVEQFFYMYGAHYFMKLIRALPLPDLNGGVSKWKQKKIEKIFAYVSEELKKGDNFLIYPSGKLKLTGAEIIGGASFVHNLIQECSEVNVVLMRTTGLWGSRFSRAITGTSPDFLKTLLTGLKIVIQNLIFLTPRRDILIEIAPAPENFPWKGSRLELNQYLERWYNIQGPEPVKLVSDYFWKKHYPQVYVPQEIAPETETLHVDPKTEREIFGKIGELARKNTSDIQRNQHLSRDLGLDSLDIAQLYSFLDEKYDLGEAAPSALQTVEDVLKFTVGQKKKSQERERPKEERAKWPEELARPAATPPQGNTIAEAFLKICDKMDSRVACADAISGVMTYRKFKMAALILSYKLREYPGDNIGILLPSTTAAYLLIFAAQLAGKTPVMLNWTVGSRALDHAVSTVNLKCVLSSRKFLNHLNNGDLGKVDDILVLLEDVRSEITLIQKLKGFLGLFKSCSTLLKNLKLGQVDENAPAVILFTSGTESLPKGVPLSHRNILSNQKSAAGCIDFQASDVLYGVLPPFHSFGFSVTGILPILTGLKVYYAPDPTDGHGMAHDISSQRVTLLCCAPTFLQGLFRAAEPEQLSSLRYVVSGAEKAPQELFDFVKKLGDKKEMLEGYGITECSPMVTLCRPLKPKIGVGQPIPGVELIVIDPETHQVLPVGSEGEICIHGPNVFSGYLGTQKSPFITLNGKEWYRSGDRGVLDADQNLTLSGRLKRFVKIGGEMISLGGIEEELYTISQKLNWAIPKSLVGPPFAVAALEKESEKPQIVLFSAIEVSKEEINNALSQSGYGRIIKIAQVRKLDQLPLTGTGKVHYRLLDDLLHENIQH